MTYGYAETILRLMKHKATPIQQEALEIACKLLLIESEAECGDSEREAQGESEADEMRREWVATRTLEINQDMRQAA